jgi:hypothetical protein
VKSNFGKSKRWLPKKGGKRTLDQSSAKGSLRPVITKPLDMEAIKKAQEDLKEKV